MQIKLSDDNLRLFHDLEVLYRKKTKHYAIQYTALVNLMVKEALIAVIADEKKAK